MIAPSSTKATATSSDAAARMLTRQPARETFAVSDSSPSGVPMATTCAPGTSTSSAPGAAVTLSPSSSATMETPVFVWMRGVLERDLPAHSRVAVISDPVEREAGHLLLQGGEVLGDARRPEQLRKRAGVVARSVRA